MANISSGGKKRVMHVGSYQVGKTLGNGSFGKVKLGTNVFTKEKVAIKFFNHRKISTAQQIENTRREIEIMKLLSHPNIVKLIDVIEKEEESTTYLIAEYVSGGELFDYIVANGVVKEKQARHFMRQIICAVEFCHANLVVHRDLKPENLLLDANGNIKISDFGLSNMIEPGKLLDSFCGSPLYAAPEILLAERYVGPPVDVWSIGVILFALLCGHLPWNGESQAEISHNSIKGLYDQPTDVSASGRDIIRKMLNPNPRERITIAEIRKHPWMSEGCDGLPPSMLTVRQPVFELKDEIIDQLMELGFKSQDEIRKQILDNECCQVVAMYHLILDKKVAEEVAELKKTMPIAIASAPNPSPSKIQPQNKTVLSKLVNMNSAKLSPLRTPTALAAIVEEANEISAAEWNKIQECDNEEQETPQQRTGLSQSLGYIHQHEQAQVRCTDPSLVNSPRQIDGRTYHGKHDRGQQHSGRAQLSSSVPVPELAFERGRHRRNSVASDHTPPNRIVLQSSGELSNARSYCRSQQRREQQQQPQQEYNQHPPRGRKFSLDSRALTEQNQVSTEFGGNNQTQQGPGAPRLVKGVFKSSTTTTRSPADAAKIVKKALDGGSYYMKRRSPFIFECFDEDNGVKFQIEVCKISQLDMTGIHLKRLVGDIWLYKNMCTLLVNKLGL